MTPKQYWYTLSGSFTQPHFYVQILNQSLSKSIQFFGISAIFLGLISAWLMTQFAYPQYRQAFHQMTTQISDHYPSNLTVEWQNQHLSTNSEEPVSLYYPSTISQHPTELLAVLDPQLDPTQFDQVNQRLPASSLAVIGETDLFINDGLGNWSQLPLTDVPYFDQSFSLTSQTLPTVLDQAEKQFGQLLTVLQPVLYFILPLNFFVSGMWMGMWYALISQVILSLYGKNFGYKKIFQLSLHLIVVAQTVSLIAQYLYPNLSFSLFSLTYWSLFVVLTFTLRQVSAVKLVVPQKRQP